MPTRGVFTGATLALCLFAIALVTVLNPTINTGNALNFARCIVHGFACCNASRVFEVPGCSLLRDGSRQIDTTTTCRVTQTIAASFVALNNWEANNSSFDVPLLLRDTDLFSQTQASNFQDESQWHTSNVFVIHTGVDCPAIVLSLALQLILLHDTVNCANVCGRVERRFVVIDDDPLRLFVGQKLLNSTLHSSVYKNGSITLKCVVFVFEWIFSPKSELILPASAWWKVPFPTGLAVCKSTDFLSSLPPATQRSVLVIINDKLQTPCLIHSLSKPLLTQ